MSIYSGFEGYRQPSSEDVANALTHSHVAFDTNVLLDLYALPAAARVHAVSYMETIGDRLWVPHQALQEFWRNRHTRILDQRKKVSPLTSVRSELLAIVNSLRPDDGRTEDIEAIRASVLGQLDLLETEIQRVSGPPLDVDAIIRSPSEDPVLLALDAVLAGRVGAPSDDFSDLVNEGLRRFERNQPPGYADGVKKKDQIPERGTGDFLIWEQTLRHMASLGIEHPFVLVTRDGKEDWRLLADGKRIALGARPELVEEAISRTGQRVIILSPTEFYSAMAGLVADEASSQVQSLIESSATLDSDEAAASDTWTFDAYQELLARLLAGSYQAQHDVILAAASNKRGIVDRASIYRIAGYENARSLRRFSLPASRVMFGLIDSGVIGDGVPSPLLAIYDGPGKAAGYEVPREFVQFAASAREQMTWIDAAATAASTDPLRAWSVRELVDKVEELELRDLRNAATPEATLGRDLRLRQDGVFEHTEDGRWKLRAPEASDDD